MEMSKKLNAVIPDETWEALEEIATKEMRTKSQMAAILLGEGIAEYRRRNSLKAPDISGSAQKSPSPDTETKTKTPPATKAKRGSVDV